MESNFEMINNDEFEHMWFFVKKSEEIIEEIEPVVESN